MVEQKSYMPGVESLSLNRVIILGNRTKVDSIKAESQKSGIRRTLTE